MVKRRGVVEQMPANGEHSRHHDNSVDLLPLKHPVFWKEATRKTSTEVQAADPGSHGRADQTPPDQHDHKIPLRAASSQHVQKGPSMHEGIAALLHFVSGRSASPIGRPSCEYLGKGCTTRCACLTLQQCYPHRESAAIGISAESSIMLAASKAEGNSSIDRTHIGDASQVANVGLCSWSAKFHVLLSAITFGSLLTCTLGIRALLLAYAGLARRREKQAGIFEKQEVASPQQSPRPRSMLAVPRPVYMAPRVGPAPRFRAF